MKENLILNKIMWVVFYKNASFCVKIAIKVKCTISGKSPKHSESQGTFLIQTAGGERVKKLVDVSR